MMVCKGKKVGDGLLGSSLPPHPIWQTSHSTSPHTPNFITAHPQHNSSLFSGERIFLFGVSNGNLKYIPDKIIKSNK